MADWYDNYSDFLKSAWEQTRLSEEDEKKFKASLISSTWFKQIKSEIEHEQGSVSDDALFADLTGPQADYDYRGAWKSGAHASDYEYDEKQHWPSATSDGKMLKSPSHPTAWMEFFMEETGEDPNSLGLKDAEDARRYTEKQKDYAAFRQR